MRGKSVSERQRQRHHVGIATIVVEERLWPEEITRVFTVWRRRPRWLALESLCSSKSLH